MHTATKTIRVSFFFPFFYFLDVSKFYDQEKEWTSTMLCKLQALNYSLLLMFVLLYLAALSMSFTKTKLTLKSEKYEVNEDQWCCQLKFFTITLYHKPLIFENTHISSIYLADFGKTGKFLPVVTFHIIDPYLIFLVSAELEFFSANMINTFMICVFNMSLHNDSNTYVISTTNYYRRQWGVSVWLWNAFWIKLKM